MIQEEAVVEGLVAYAVRLLLTNSERTVVIARCDRGCALYCVYPEPFWVLRPRNFARKHPLCLILTALCRGNRLDLNVCYCLGSRYSVSYHDIHLV